MTFLSSAPGGDLQTLLDEDLVPYERDVKGFLRQLLIGLLSIHNLGIVHLDIKVSTVAQLHSIVMRLNVAIPFKLMFNV